MSSRLNVCTVIGARPQFIKAAVVSRALKEAGVAEQLVHTGQHYDAQMSSIFFTELGIPEPAVNLEVGSGSHAVQTGEMMMRLESFLQQQVPRPDWLLVYGDTNSTLAGALVAAKIHLSIAHVEAGLRSFNNRMPEEINRVVTDRLSQKLFCPGETAVQNLKDEGIVHGVHVSGDVMYDAILRFRPVALERYPLETLIDYRPDQYYLATVHRAENTDDRDRLERLLFMFGCLDLPVVWPVHPRTRSRLQQFGLSIPSRVAAIEPVGYFQMLSLLSGARRVLTDSGGLQKEAFWMQKPCITLRSESEWIETLIGDWNQLSDLDAEHVIEAVRREPTGHPGAYYGDGTAALKIAEILIKTAN